VGVRPFLSDLYELSNADTHICFDYPVTILATVQGVIFSGHLNHVGEVEFRYSRHEQDNEVHKAQLAYTVSQEHESFCVRVPLRFVAPELDRVLAVAHEIGFLSSTSPLGSASFFLPGEFVFVELQKQEVLRK